MGKLTGFQRSVIVAQSKTGSKPSYPKCQSGKSETAIRLVCKR